MDRETRAALRADVANAVRIVRARPGFALAVGLTLALGIGASTGAFGLVHAVLLSPLPYGDSDDLYGIVERHSSGRTRVPSYPTFEDWRSESDAFEELAFVRGARVIYRTQDQGSGLLIGSFVTEGFFEMLRVPAETGRVLSADDHRPGADGAAVLSHRAWRRWFGSDPDILGRALSVGESSFTIVGVMPATFAYPDWGVDNDLWLPLPYLPASERAALAQRGFNADGRVVGRLRGDVPHAEAQRAFNRLAERLAVAYPTVNEDWTRADIQSLKELEIGGVGRQLYLLWGAATLVLVMCCLNLANLYLVQGSRRRREYAVRTALGAHRVQLFRQILGETLALALGGGLLGLALAHVGLTWAKTGPLSDLPRVDELGLDGVSVLFAFGLAWATAFLFALLVARQTRGASVADDLRGTTSGAGRPTLLLSGIQAAQVSMTFVLLLGTWLLGETFLKLSSVDPGYEPEGLMVAQVNPPSPAYDAEEAVTELYSGLLAAVEALPGVASAAFTNHGPGGFAGALTPAAPGAVPEDAERDLSVLYRTVSPGYFETLQAPLLAGRAFAPDDARGGEGPMVVNRTLAAALGGPREALGQTVGVRKAASTRADFGEPLMGRTIGVVSDFDVTEAGGSPAPAVYVPYTHSPWPAGRLLIRARDTSPAMMTAIEEAISSVDAGIPVSGPFVGVSRVEDLRWAEQARERLNAGLVAGFAGLALLLACIGMYGVISFIVALKKGEIGVRIALGASPASVALRMVGHAVVVGGVGLLTGMGGALLISPPISDLLFEVDPLAADRYVVLAVLLLALTATAAFVPARRASRTDPALVLRTD